MMMILVITHKEDFTADFVINKLNERSIPYFRLNCEDIIENNYEFSRQEGLNFTINGIKSFSSVWYRRTKLPSVDLKSESDRLFILSDYSGLLENILQNIQTENWLSNPNSVAIAENKILQLRWANEIGFLIPDTLITNNNKHFQDFITKHDFEVIIKPIRNGRIMSPDGNKAIYTNLITSEIIKNIAQYDLTPCIFQKYIQKAYEIRVTVVGKDVYAAKVESQKKESTKIDWRREKTPFSREVLPKEIEEKCIAITHKFGLKFGAIDLIRSIDGNYFFLEINPNGQWAWIESDTDLPISESIIKVLTK